MSVFTFPGFRVASFRWHKSSPAITTRGPFGAQSLGVGSPLWEVSMMGVSEDRPTARVVDAYIDSLDGFTNQVELWNLENPVPAGTMRGAMVLAADAAQGAVSLTISAGAGQAGKTILKGDFLGLGSGITQQVVKAAANATADGSGQIVIPIGTPMRNAFVSGATVIWNMPKALFRQKSLSDGVEYIPDGASPWALSLIEDVRP